jgi:hypothetical protein
MNKGVIIMKKFLALSLLLGTSAMFVPAAEAKTADINTTATSIESNASPQMYRQRRNGRGVRVVTRTRIVRAGFRTYREVIQTRYLPNGRVTTRVVSRTRIR